MTLSTLSLARHSCRSYFRCGLSLGLCAALLGTVSASGAAPSQSSGSYQSAPTSTYVDPSFMQAAYGYEEENEVFTGAVPDVRVNETPLQHASQNYSQNHFEKAVPELEIILKKTPQDVKARLLLSAIYLRQSQAQKAVPQLEAAAGLENAAGFHPDFELETSDTQNLLATAYLQTGQTQKAIRLERASLARAPKDPQTAFQLGVALEQAGNSSEAANAFAEAASLSRKDSVPFLLAGLLYHQVGDDAKSVPALNRALALGVSHKFEIYSALAEAASNAGNFQEAVTDDTLALKLQPSDFPTLANLGVENQNLGRTEQARALYQQALALKTGDAKSRAEISAYLQNLDRA